MPPCSWCENGGCQAECEAIECWHDCFDECKVASLEPDELGRYIRLPAIEKGLFFTPQRGRNNESVGHSELEVRRILNEQ